MTVITYFLNRQIIKKKKINPSFQKFGWISMYQYYK